MELEKMPLSQRVTVHHLKNIEGCGRFIITHKNSGAKNCKIIRVQQIKKLSAHAFRNDQSFVLIFCSLSPHSFDE